ncbi:hypothetical protein D3C75_1070350 [compost metagenome]
MEFSIDCGTERGGCFVSYLVFCGGKKSPGPDGSTSSVPYSGHPGGEYRRPTDQHIDDRLNQLSATLGAGSTWRQCNRVRFAARAHVRWLADR